MDFRLSNARFCAPQRAGARLWNTGFSVARSTREDCILWWNAGVKNLWNDSGTYENNTLTSML
jgi:hypothetical protein